MSLSLAGYPSGSSVIHAIRRGGDPDPQFCPGCDAMHPDSYRFSVCAHPGCGQAGCHECLGECRIAPHGDKQFCALHLNQADIGRGTATCQACPACEKFLLDGEDEMEEIRRRA